MARFVPPAVPDTLFELSNIHKRWSGAPTSLLQGVSLGLEPGSALWLEGRNGVGKTTLLRIAAGLIRPDAGEIRLCGLDPETDRLEFQRRLGYVSTGYGGLYARLKVRFHLEFWADVACVDPERRAELIERVIERLDLAPLIDARVDRLSMGQRQRVRLALGFMHEPAVIILDEPRNSLDDVGTALLAAASEEVRERGGGVIWCAPIGEPVGLDGALHVRIEDGRLLEI